MRVVARLRDGVSRAQAEDELRAVADGLAREYPDTNSGYSVDVVPLHDALTIDAAPVLWFLAGTVAFLLVLACLNVTSVSLAAMAARGPEFAIRASLGARRRDVARQILTESLVVAGLGCAAGLLLAHWLVPILVSVGEAAIPRSDEIGLHPIVVAWTAGLAVAAALVSSGVPALALHRLPGLAALGTRKGSSTGHANQRVLQSLVVIEIGLALLLLVGTGLMTRSLALASRVSIGFDAAGVTSASLTLPLRTYPDQETQARLIERLLDALKHDAGIARAGILMRPPLGGSATSTFTVHGSPVAAGQEPWADYRTASEDTFATLRVPLLAGRIFTSEDTDKSADVVIVNETLARRFWPGRDALGQALQIGAERTRWRRVVGVVGDVRMTSLEKAVEPAIYVPYQQNSWSNALALGFVMLRTSKPGVDPAPAAQRALRSLDRGLALGDVRTLEELIQRSLGRRRFSTMLVTLFGVLGYLLAALGVYGVMSNMVSQRSYELAVRAALGAPQRRTFLSVVLRGGLLGALGCGLGLTLVALLSHRVSSLLYGIGPMDRLTVSTALVLLLGVSTAACVLPARRATSVDPLVTMRGGG